MIEENIETIWEKKGELKDEMLGFKWSYTVIESCTQKEAFFINIQI